MALAAAVSVRPGLAQEQSPESTSAEPVEEVVVTGTRVQLDAREQASPVVIVTSEAIWRSGEGSLVEYLDDYPALLQSRSNESTGGGTIFFVPREAGINALNLRGLGENRTLTLVNGRRHVGGAPNSTAVDVNTIPSGLVERVDILTGGISAVYGADGVSGVVNFILRDDFEGFEVWGQTGISGEGDADQRQMGFLAGSSFVDGRGNVALSYEYREQDRLSSSERSIFAPYTAQYLLYNPDDPSSYTYTLESDVRYAQSSPDGAYYFGFEDVDEEGNSYVNFSTVPDARGTGSPYDLGEEIHGFAIGGSGTPAASYSDLLPDSEQHVANVNAKYRFSSAARVFVEAKYATSETYTFAEPNFDLFGHLEGDNAFLVDRFGAAAQYGALYSRDNLDMPFASDRSIRDTLRGVLGVDGDVSDNLHYEVAYTWGETSSDSRLGGSRYSDRYYAAIDAIEDPASGNIVCRSDLFPDDFVYFDEFGGEYGATTFAPGPGSGCIPLNIVGDGVADQAALDWAYTDGRIDSKITQQVISGIVTGATGNFVKLPGGPVGYAAGVEYREESSRSTPDEAFQNDWYLDLGPYSDDHGRFDVTEVFAEFGVPILEEKPYAHHLYAGAALRASDYSTVGRTTSWKLDGVYAPIEDVTFRASYSRAVRAPNIGELYAGTSSSFTTITDPCDFDPDVRTVDQGSQFREANCIALLQELGLSDEDIAGFYPNSSPTSTAADRTDVRGNPGLEEESATTWTAGTVVRPSFAPGLVVAVDWYDIEIANAINTAHGQELANLCVDQPTIDNPFCDGVIRNDDPASPSFAEVIAFSTIPLNVAQFDTSGLDVSLSWTWQPRGEFGEFDFSLVGNYLKTLNFLGTPGGEVSSSAGQQPRHSAIGSINWSKERLLVTYGLTWQSRTKRFSNDEIEADPMLAPEQFFYVKERWEHDLSATFDAIEFITIYGGINNLTNEEPDTAAFTVPVSPVGRYYFLGFKFAM